MQYRLHGKKMSLEDLQSAFSHLDTLNASVALPFMFAPPRRLTDFGYLFPDLQQDPANLLPEGLETIVALKKLGESMAETSPLGGAGNNLTIPAAYTYLGQFIDHDITLEAMSSMFGPLDSDTPVFSAQEVLQRVRNTRTATLDLDSVYDSPAPFDGADQMLVGSVTDVGNPVPGKGPDNDLPRTPRSAQPPLDRAALIGEARNDENLIISQLHVAFLKAHNAIVNRGHSFDSARRLLRQLYQWVVVKDFLVKVAGQDVVDKALQGNLFFNPSAAEFFMPLEFSVAAYRFGHSMVRDAYDFNVNFGSNGIQGQATFDLLFTFTAFSGQLGPGAGTDTLPGNWIIQWENFVNPTPNPTRKIDIHLVEPLFNLNDVGGNPQPGIMAQLATRNLLRGYRLRMPTGQAVAQAMAQKNSSITTLTKAEILNVAASSEQRQLLEETGFAERTPLWFYILAEAEVRQHGQRLGPVGATIVAEVLIGLVGRSADSFLELGEGWNPSQLEKMGFSADFALGDLLRLGGVL